jgi:hypothetical protein
MLVQQAELDKLFIFTDLHAHAAKKGCFMFGNALQGEKQLNNMTLPKLVALNSLNFDYVECSFSEKIMNCKDKKDGLSREGSGRVGIFRATGITHCYTLECNYQTGRRINHLYPKMDKKKNAVEPELPSMDPNNKIYTEAKTPNYCPEIFEEVGRAFLIGILDFVDDNPISRLPTSCYKCLDAVKTEIMVQQNIFIPGFKKVPKTSSGVTNVKLMKGIVSKNTRIPTANPAKVEPKVPQK